MSQAPHFTVKRSAGLHHGSLRQRLSTLSTLAMAFAILNTWIALAGSIGLILPSGGSVAFLYGFLLCLVCSFCVAASLGELAAIWPTAGGQYHYVFALCTEKWRKPVSFFVGWTNIAGWLIVVTVQGYFAGKFIFHTFYAQDLISVAQFISAAIVVASNDSYQITAARTYGIFLAVLTATTAINIWGNNILGRWNTGALYWSVLGVVVTSIVLLAKSAKTDAKYVFTDFKNETNWPDGVAWILGLVQSALSLTAYDVVLHMTEEMPNPRRDAPRALIYAIAVGGLTGFLFILVILFCLTDPTSVLTAPGNMPIVAMVLRATQSRAAACIISLMISVCFINGSSASITSVSRLLFAMARDRGIIFHDFFAHITPHLNVPLQPILLCYGFNVCFGLLYLGPRVAFSAYVASLVILLNLSYAAPTIIVLIRGRQLLSTARSTKDFHLSQSLGIVVNYVSVLFLTVTSIKTADYVCVVLGIFAVIVSLFWLKCRSTFLGPNLDMIANHGRNAGSLQVEKVTTTRPNLETLENRT
ncbi:choline transport protein [Beauveria bassiana ARSEF 2860]|uniref:Choline transport protein n=1 Tax=Beauveria bassiana (strain ARSEF 2860) TaxID=655819 RepID=J4WCU6_BEAB2|nr:choline transport protein [Beauveria bassiana ARSEF 2860]EJP67880.1 choline transport protein [Beauveria bassiana ARSEF 2860]